VVKSSAIALPPTAVCIWNHSCNVKELVLMKFSQE
jgi:hypothetical protein